MDTRTPAIPLKQQEKSHHQKKERADVSLPPLTPFVQQRQRARSLPGGLCKQQHSHGFPTQQTQKKHPYRVLQIGATPLMHACQQADRARVLKLLKTQEETIGYRDRTLRSALHYCMDAATGGAVAAAAPELVNAPDAEGHTPLHLAVIAGDTQLVAVLLANGADVNAKDIEGHSVLHWATVCGEVECVRVLLSAGAKPSIPDLRGGSPLHYAAQCCGAAATAELTIPKKISLKVLQTLLEFGANVNARDEDGRQPILWAASAGSVDAVLALSRAGGLAVAGSSDKDGLTALHCAASRGHARCVETLVNLCGAQPDHVDDNGCSALHYSATLGHADATALLLKLGADPNRQDRKGRTPAICAAAKGQLETLKILAQHGGSLHVRTVRGTGIGHEAVASGRIELIKWLVKKRPNLLDVATQDGKTPLHVAALHGHLDVCKLLLDNGVRINSILRTGKGNLMTALDAALYRGHRDCAKLIQMHGGSTAQQIRMHKNVPCKVFSARLRLKNSESSSDTDSSPRRIRKHKPELYYEEHWMERRTRKRGSGRKLSRQGSRSFSEEELRVMKETKKKNLHRRSHSESRRYIDDRSSEELLKKIKRSSKRRIKYNSSSLESESEEENGRSRSKTGKSQVVTVSKREEYEELVGDGSVSEDSLEVIVRTKSMEKYEKVVSGKKHKSPGERSEKKFSRKRAVKKGIEYEEEVSDKEMAVDSNRRRSKEAEGRFDQETTDSTSQEIGEKVTVTAIIHKDQVPDTPKDDTQDENNCKDESSGKLDNIMDKTAEEYPSSLITKAADMKKDVEEMRQQTVLKQQEDSNERSALARRRTSIKESDIEALRSLVQEEENKEEQKEDKTPTPMRRRSSIREKDIEAIKQIAVKNEEKIEGNKSSSKRRSSIKDLDTIKSLKDERKLSIFTPAEQEEQRRRSQEKDQLLQVINDDTEEISSGEPEQSNQTLEDDRTDDIQQSDSNVKNNEDNLKTKSRRNSVMSVTSDKKSPRSSGAKNQSAQSADNADDEEEEFEKDQSFQVLDMKTDAETMRRMSTTVRIADDEEESKIKMDENEAETKCEEQKTKSMDESSSGSPVPPKSAKSRPSTGKNKRRPSSSKQTLFESSEEQSPDRSAIVAVIESPEWDEQEELEKEAIGEEHIEHEAIAKVLPSTSEEETPRLSGTFKPVMSDAIIQVETKPSVRIVGPDCADESQDRTKLNQRRDSGGRDSGIEPSPRASRIPRRTMKCCPVTQKQQQLRMETVTRDVQISLRRYHLERRIFFQLMELKRLQIRHGRTNEHVLVKRQVDTFNKSGMTGPILGVVKYDHQPLTFRHFEKFLYEQLRKLQKRPATPDWCTEARQCTKKTHQCHHATSAYTSVPIYTYLGGSVPERGTGLLPKIESRGSGHMTVEVTHGEEKRVIALPAEKLNPNKRYFFTFTVKGDAQEVENDEPTDGAQTNTKSE